MDELPILETGKKYKSGVIIMPSKKEGDKLLNIYRNKEDFRVEKKNGDCTFSLRSSFGLEAIIKKTPIGDEINNRGYDSLKSIDGSLLKIKKEANFIIKDYVDYDPNTVLPLYTQSPTDLINFLVNNWLPQNGFKDLNQNKQIASSIIQKLKWEEHKIEGDATNSHFINGDVLSEGIYSQEQPSREQLDNFLKIHNLMDKNKIDLHYPYINEEVLGHLKIRDVYKIRKSVTDIPINPVDIQTALLDLEEYKTVWSIIQSFTSKDKDNLTLRNLITEDMEKDMENAGSNIYRLMKETLERFDGTRIDTWSKNLVRYIQNNIREYAKFKTKSKDIVYNETKRQLPEVLDETTDTDTINLVGIADAAWGIYECLLGYLHVINRTPEYTIARDNDHLFKKLMENGAFNKAKEPGLIAVYSGSTIQELHLYKLLELEKGFQGKQKEFVDLSGPAISVPYWVWPDQEGFTSVQGSARISPEASWDGEWVFMQLNSLCNIDYKKDSKELMGVYKKIFSNNENIYPFITVSMINNPTDYKFKKNLFIKEILRHLVGISDEDIDKFVPYSEKFLIEKGKKSYYWAHGAKLPPQSKDVVIYKQDGSDHFTIPSSLSLILRLFYSFRLSDDRTGKSASRAGLISYIDEEKGAAALYRKP